MYNNDMEVNAEELEIKPTNRHRHKLIKLLIFSIKDIINTIRNGPTFNEYGVSIYVGKQGDGKTISMVDYLERMRLKFPKCKILTNFGYKFEDEELDSWEKIFNYRNGRDGVIFAIDEIQNEYDSTKWKEFPEALLSQVTMQRKQKIKIICSSQVYTRMVKQLREQCFEVIECKTILGRLTITRCFDAWDYEAYHSDPEKKDKLRRLWRWAFIQDDYIRSCYDTDKIIERMKKAEYLPREIRHQNKAV
jgi:hypothetical protein